MKAITFALLPRLLLVCLTVGLAGCDLEALLADPKVVQKEADSRAIGGACRHGLRSIEDCYSMNEKASKAAIFAGWKDMDQYMRDNKIDGIEPKGLKPPAPAASTPTGENAGASEPASDNKAEATAPKDNAKASSKSKTAKKPAA